MFSLIKIISWLVFLWTFPGAAPAQGRDSVTLYAAASLKDALDALVKMRESQAHANLKVAYAASSTLARQIERGAPADLFISADSDWMDYLAQRKLLRAGTRVNLLSNRLVLIAPREHKSDLVIGQGFPLAAALSKDRLAMADPDSVPAGKYGKAALVALGVWGEVSRHITRSENVRAALALVARGEAPFGIVYASDAVAERKVRVLGEFPAHTHPAVLYPAAILADSRSGAAAAMLGFLRSAEARVVWRRHGFGAAD